MRLKRFLLCLFLGFSGIHKFAEGKTGLGILYLLTFGLFGIGWIYDCIMYLTAAITRKERDTDYTDDAKPSVLMLAAAFIFLLLAIVGMPGISGFLGAAGVVLCFPAITWQNFINNRMHIIVKTVSIIVLMTATVLFSPDADITKEVAADTETNAVLADVSAEPTLEPSPEPTVNPTPETAEDETDACDYVLNTNSKRFHYPSCGSVTQMKDKNKQEFHGTRDELIEKGYKPCGNCEP